MSKLVDLIVDKEDKYDNQEILFMFPNHLSNLACASPNILKSGKFKIFLIIYKVEIIINQPI